MKIHYPNHKILDYFYLFVKLHLHLLHQEVHFLDIHLKLHLNTQITPTINRMIQLQKEVQNLDVILNKTKGIETALIQANEKIENSTNQILSEKIDEKSKILDEIIQKQNQTIYKKQLFLISISCLVLGVLIGYFL